MKRRPQTCTLGVLSVICLLAVPGQVLSGSRSAIDWVGGVGNSLSQPPGFYSSQEAVRIAETVLLVQRNNGGWPKNYDRARVLSQEDREKLLSQRMRTRHPTRSSTPRRAHIARRPSRRASGASYSVR